MNRREMYMAARGALLRSAALTVVASSTLVLSCAPVTRAQLLDQYAHEAGIFDPSSIAKDPKKLFERGRYFLDRGLYEVAIADFEDALALGGKDSADGFFPRRELGVAYVLRSEEMLNLGNTYYRARVRAILGYAKVHLEASLAEVPEGNERAREYLARADATMARLPDWEREWRDEQTPRSRDFQGSPPVQRF